MEHVMQRAIIQAAAKGDIGSLEVFLDSSEVNVNGPDQNGDTALHAASQNGHIECVKHLIMHDADLHCPGYKNCTPLLKAAANCHTDIMSLLITKGAKIIPDPLADTALHQAVQSGHIESVKLLLSEQENDELIDALGYKGTTPLMRAVFSKDRLPIVKELLEADADMMIETSDCKDNVLHFACQSGDPNLIKELLTRGCEQLINKKGYKNSTPLMRACAANCPLECIKFLVRLGAEVIHKSEEGDTALHFAAQCGDYKVPLLLLAQPGALDLIEEAGFLGSTPLMRAAASGSVEVIEALTNQGAEVTKKSKFRDSALHQAAEQGHVKAAVYLLQKGAKSLIDDRDNNGFTPLHRAVKNNQTEMVKTLLDWNADPSTEAYNGDSPLHTAASQDAVKLIKILTDSPACRKNSYDTFGYTAVMRAAANGNTQAIVALIKGGANIFISAQQGKIFSQLVAEAKKDNTSESGKQMLERVGITYILHNAFQKIRHEQQSVTNPAACTNSVQEEKVNLSDLIPRSKADLYNDISLDCNIDYFKSHGTDQESNPNVLLIPHDGDTVVHVAARAGQEEAIRLLIESGADFDCVGADDYTPLHLAAIDGHKKIVEHLLQAGAQLSATTHESDTALHLAAENGHEETVDAIATFYQSKAKPPKPDFSIDIPGNNKTTALWRAAKNGHIGVVKLLVATYRADVNKDIGSTPLYIAAENNHEKVVQYLIDHGADSSIKSSDGYAPLHIAAMTGNLDSCKSLLDKGANINILAMDGSTPLLQAVSKGHDDIVRLLLANGCDLTLVANDSTDVFTAAVNGKHADILKLLVNR